MFGYEEISLQDKLNFGVEGVLSAFTMENTSSNVLKNFLSTMEGLSNDQVLQCFEIPSDELVVVHDQQTNFSYGVYFNYKTEEISLVQVKNGLLKSNYQIIVKSYETELQFPIALVS